VGAGSASPRSTWNTTNVFFFDYEVNRQDSALHQDGFGTHTERDAGDYTILAQPMAKPVTFYDPFDTFKTPAALTCAILFAGNIVPKSECSARSLLKSSGRPIPNPTGTETPFHHLRQPNFFGQGSESEPRKISWTQRIDPFDQRRQPIMSRTSRELGAKHPRRWLWSSKSRPILPPTRRQPTARTQNFVDRLHPNAKRDHAHHLARHGVLPRPIIRNQIAGLPEPYFAGAFAAVISPQASRFSPTFSPGGLTSCTGQGGGTGLDRPAGDERQKLLPATRD